MENIIDIIQLSKKIESTYGPNGRDKLIIKKDGELLVSNGNFK
jgi:chaperonin GroEL (HSP60 family)